MLVSVTFIFSSLLELAIVGHKVKDLDNNEKPRKIKPLKKVTSFVYSIADQLILTYSKSPLQITVSKFD